MSIVSINRLNQLVNDPDLLRFLMGDDDLRGRFYEETLPQWLRPIALIPLNCSLNFDYKKIHNPTGRDEPLTHISCL